jgi:hypothetical protein
MHSPLFQAPLKETAAGEGVTLFGWGATPNLAVFQTIIDKFVGSANSRQIYLDI